jgi:hypothetical protein
MHTGVSKQNAAATATKTTGTHGTLDQKTMDDLSTAMHGEAFAYVKYLLYAEHSGCALAESNTRMSFFSIR